VTGNVYDIDGSRVPVFRSESGKALGDLGPVFASNFVSTWVESTRVVEDDQANVTVVVGCKCFDEGSICESSWMRSKDG
jgi:hypothetical protein